MGKFGVKIPIPATFVPIAQTPETCKGPIAPALVNLKVPSPAECPRFESPPRSSASPPEYQQPSRPPCLVGSRSVKELRFVDPESREYRAANGGMILGKGIVRLRGDALQNFEYLRAAARKWMEDAVRYWLGTQFSLQHNRGLIYKELRPTSRVADRFSSVTEVDAIITSAGLPSILVEIKTIGDLKRVNRARQQLTMTLGLLKTRYPQIRGLALIVKTGKDYTPDPRRPRIVQEGRLVMPLLERQFERTGGDIFSVVLSYSEMGGILAALQCQVPEIYAKVFRGELLAAGDAAG